MGISIPKYREQLKKNLDDDSNDVNDVNNLNKDINYYVQFHHGDDSFITSNKKHRTLKYVTDQLLFNELLENPTLIDPFTPATYESAYNKAPKNKKDIKDKKPTHLKILEEEIGDNTEDEDDSAELCRLVGSPPAPISWQAVPSQKLN